MIKTIVLAAGKGTRLRSRVPKVLHKVFDKPILSWVLDSVAEIQQKEIIVVCGYKAEQVEAFLHAYPISTVRQETQMGTGHAVQSAAHKLVNFNGTVLIVNGDAPLIKGETLSFITEYHQSVGSDMTLLTCSVSDPHGYGRILRRNNRIIGIKEEKDCSEAELFIKEINAGVYCFEWSKIKEGLRSLKSNNAQEEYYLTDLVAWAYTQGLNISNYEINDPSEVMGINTRADLAKVMKIKNKMALNALMENGVTILDPKNTVISPEVEIGQDTVIYPGTYIQRRVSIGKNCLIGPNTSIFGPAEIGSNSSIIQSHVAQSSIGENSIVGPFAHLRDGNDIGNNVRVGNFVELKNCSVGDNSSMAHLSYLGDSKIKSNVNIGAGTITANFDSRTGEKNQTFINSGASTGANSVLVAPVVIGQGSCIAAGSVITEDVPPEHLAIARPRQENKMMKIPKS
jgi:bifunctional UDP-N-acetylglucosamine pyrophosphorylase / glucosamine-1-phosphate N-acetyltransferase